MFFVAGLQLAKVPELLLLRHLLDIVLVEMQKDFRAGGSGFLLELWSYTFKLMVLT